MLIIQALLSSIDKTEHLNHCSGPVSSLVKYFFVLGPGVIKVCLRQLYKVMQSSSAHRPIHYCSPGHRWPYLMELCNNLSIRSSILLHLYVSNFSQGAFWSLYSVFLGYFQTYLTFLFYYDTIKVMNFIIAFINAHTYVHMHTYTHTLWSFLTYIHSTLTQAIQLVPL